MMSMTSGRMASLGWATLVAFFLALSACSTSSASLAVVEPTPSPGGDAISVPAEIAELGLSVLYPAFVPPGYEFNRVERAADNRDISFVFGPPGTAGTPFGGNYITVGLLAGAPLSPFGSLVNPHRRIEFAGRTAYLIQGETEPVFSLTKDSPDRRPTGPNGEALQFEPIDVLALELERDGFRVSIFAIPPQSSTPEVLIEIAESLTLVRV